MAISATACITLLLLSFTHFTHFTHGQPPIGPAPEKPAPKGPPPKETAQPYRKVYWDARFNLQAGVAVYNQTTGLQIYDISQDPDAKRGFRIRQFNDTYNILLEATDKKKATCGHAYTFHTDNGVSYRVAGLVHHHAPWHMDIAGMKASFTYDPNHSDVKQSKKVTASFKFQTPNMTLEIYEPLVEPYHYIGLWILASKYSKRCHKANIAAKVAIGLTAAPLLIH